MNNISKYLQLDDYILLEYEFNRDGEELDLSTASVDPFLLLTDASTKQYINSDNGLGYTNNTLDLNSIPLTRQRNLFYVKPGDEASYFNFIDSSTSITQASYPHDRIRLHIVSGYNFDDISGFLLQVRAKDASSGFVDLSNFTWINQVLGDDVIKFSSNPIFLGNRTYDKYIEFYVPSVQNLGGDTVTNLGNALNIETLSDVYLSYSVITEIDQNRFDITNTISSRLPVTSAADSFNAFIAESTAGDFIEYYGLWNNSIIGEVMSDIESGRIRLYTSNNPNDNYGSFSNQYGAQAQKWVLIHDIQVREQLPGGTNLLTQSFSFTQEDNFSNPNYFRPVIKNADIASSFTIVYTARLMNRMDGSQIIRRASFSSLDPKKYGLRFTRLNVDNYIPYKVFNRILPEKANIVNNTGTSITKYVRVYYDSTRVLLNKENEVLPQGTGPLFLKQRDSFYKFSFDRLNENTESSENVDLSGTFNYALIFTLDDDTMIEIPPTFSSNMNTVLGELEFKITSKQALKLLKQNNNGYSIVIKNPDGSSYTFYEGLFYSYKQTDQVLQQFHSLFDVTSLNERISSLESENSELRAQLENQ